MTNRDLSLADAIAKAEQYCSRAEHCELEVVRKLYQWGCYGYRDAVVEHLRENGFVDDDRYCAAFVHDHLLINRWEPLKIYRALMSRGLPQDAVRRALGSLPEEED